MTSRSDSYTKSIRNFITGGRAWDELFYTPEEKNRMGLRLVGITGHAGSGKDSVGKFLVDTYGYTRFGYADAVKKVSLLIDPYVGDHVDRLSDKVSVHGMDFCKRAFPEVRRILQEVGNGVRQVDPYIWLRPLDRLIESDVESIVVTDVRYENEAEQIARHGGVLLRLSRPGYVLAGPLGQHISEQPLDVPAIDIVNDSDLKTLFGKVEDALVEHG